MDPMTILGILVALGAVVGGHYLDGGLLNQLVNLPAAVIVFGGTLAAAAVQSPKEEFSRALRLLGWAFGGRRYDFQQGIELLMLWCTLVRRDGILALEKEMDKHTDSFVLNGLQMLVDGKSSEAIRNSLGTELVTVEQNDLRGAKVIESMGGYAPTLGIIGAVLGLIHVMGNLKSPEDLGAGIALAFVATVYGVGIANLLLIPIANKIKGLIMTRYNYQEMMLEGMAAIAQGQNPRVIQQRLQGYMS
ncbi:flagellar motor protein [Pontibacterium sp.]|uniref:flagellar motor protein n=1 Tax=Pontibacterium sp. TaxID=2036026 RepID=UPI003562799D